MLDMGWAELLVIAIVALLAVGPEKLPEVARGLARMIRQVRRVVSELREAINLEEFEAQVRQSSQPVHPAPGMDQGLRADRATAEQEAPQSVPSSVPSGTTEPSHGQAITSTELPK